MSGLILYTTEDGQSRIQLRAEGQTVWLTQLAMAELFLTSKQNVAKHLKAIFAEGELSPDSVVNHWLTTAADGKNYRVRSTRGVQRVGRNAKRFRHFANRPKADRPGCSFTTRHSQLTIPSP